MLLKNWLHDIVGGVRFGGELALIGSSTCRESILKTVLGGEAIHISEDADMEQAAKVALQSRMQMRDSHASHRNVSS